MRLSMADTLSALPGTRPDDFSQLLRRRAGLRDEIDRVRRTLQTLTGEFQKVETAIRDIEVKHAPAPLPSPLRNGVGDFTRLVVETLRDARAPMTSRAVALRVMEKLDLDASDRALLRQIVRRVCVCLWMQVQKGYFRKAEPEGGAFRWEFVPTAQ